MCTSRFNIFNHSNNSFFTPGTQLANIAKAKPDDPAIVYISPKNTESVMTWRALEELSNRIAWYLMDQGIVHLMKDQAFLIGDPGFKQAPAVAA